MRHSTRHSFFGHTPQLRWEYNGEVVHQDGGARRVTVAQNHGEPIDVTLFIGFDGQIMLSHPCAVALERRIGEGQYEQVAEFPPCYTFSFGTDLIAVLKVGEIDRAIIIDRTGEWTDDM